MDWFNKRKKSAKKLRLVLLNPPLHEQTKTCANKSISLSPYLCPCLHQACEECWMLIVHKLQVTKQHTATDRILKQCNIYLFIFFKSIKLAS